MTGRSLAERLRAGVGAALVCTALYFLIPGFFGAVERGLLRWKYAVRGEVQADTSVVLVELTGTDIDALGGLPVKRSYYALAVSALSDLGARSIALDLGLTDSGRAPEYDEALASVIRSSGRVALGGYFRSLAAAGIPDTHGRSEVFPRRYAREVSATGGGGAGPWRSGFHFTLPLQPLLGGAAGLGHTNLSDDLGMPLAIRTRTGLLPLFSLEAFLIAHPAGATLSDDGGRLTVLAGGFSGSIPHDGSGDASINFTGKASSLQTVSLLEFLRAYDDLAAGGDGGIDPSGMAADGMEGGRLSSVRQVRDKIVVLGVAAEGRSSFVESPFGEQFPAVGLHALFIDNLLKGRFIQDASRTLVAVILLAMGAAGSMAPPGRAIRGIAVVAGMMGLYTAVSLALFSSSGLVLPLFVAWFTGAVVIVALMIDNHVAAGRELARLSGEKAAILATVGDRERKITALERTLAGLPDRGNEPGRSSLLEEIERYRAEIRTLRTAGEDLTPAGAPGAAEAPTPAVTSVTDTGEAGHGAAPGRFHGILYDPSGPMAKLVGFIGKISSSDATVLITGESGSGKEVVARAIHESSGRSGKPFVAVNCGALTETLLESELFGHEKGAFTGALKERTGRFEIAHGGTIFLDEIGETSESFQVKLLRVLQDGTFERVGGTATLKSDARVIAATNRDLARAVNERRFRADLYYRLNVLAVEVPPLRERPGDIRALAAEFLASGGKAAAVSESVMKALAAHDWKGNVRELQSVMTRGALMAAADGREMLRLRDLPEEIAAAMQSPADLEGLVIGSLREKGFSRSAITGTAEEIGGFNRGTVAEYFRGYCLDAYVGEGFDFAKAVGRIAGETSGDAARERAGKKLSEYLLNAREFIDPGSTVEAVLDRSRPKFKNLPRKYHPSLEAVIRHFQATGGGG